MSCVYPGKETFTMVAVAGRARLGRRLTASECWMLQQPAM